MALTDDNLVMPVSPMGGNGFGGGFGGDWGWIILLLLFAGGGWGGFGGNNVASDGAAMFPWMNQSNQINDGFRDQMLNSSVSGIQGAVTSGFGDIQTALCGGNVTLIQTITAPDVIAPDFLFGRITTYPFSLTAKTECGIMQLSKAYVVSIMQSDKICLLNMLNYLSRNAQKGDVSYKRMLSSDTSQRLAVMVFMLTGHRSQDIRIRYKQKDLCKLLGLRRSAMLELISELETRGVVLDNGTELQIPDRQQLVAELVKPGK